MKNMNDFKVKNWDQSYDRKENYIFFPKEEVVKFINRFVRKKVNLNEFEDRIELQNNPKALDLGCGIGRQTILLKEFGFDAYGAEISEKAINQAKELAHSFNYNLDNNFILLDNTTLPFDDDYFDIAISDSVLDSMEFSFAKQYMNELNRTVSGMVFLNIVSSETNDENTALDLIVENDHEQGTIQSYYDLNRINELIDETDFEIVQLNKNAVNDLIRNDSNVRYNIVLKKK